MKLPRLLALSVIFVLVFAVSAHAEWWRPSMPSLPSMPRMPNLNPFKQRDSHPANIGKQEEGWEWPGMTRKPTEKVEEAKPSLWQRVSGGSRSAWSKTKSTLTPWRAKPQVEEEMVITGSNSSFNQMVNGQDKQPVKRTSWFWTDGEDEKPQKASSVSDFIGGKRPQ